VNTGLQDPGSGQPFQWASAQSDQHAPLWNASGVIQTTKNAGVICAGWTRTALADFFCL